MARSERPKHTTGAADAPSPEELGLDEVDAASADSMDASDPPAFGGVTGVVGEPRPADDRLQRITARAHELWREAGSPDNRSLEFWLAAEREIDGARVG